MIKSQKFFSENLSYLTFSLFLNNIKCLNRKKHKCPVTKKPSEELQLVRLFYNND